MVDKIRKIICNNVEDLFIMIGLLIILGVTFYLSPVIGFYLLGAVFMTIGILISIYSPRIRGDDK